MTFDINLNWLAFNVDLNTVDVWMKANAGSSYCGMSAGAGLSIHFTSDPGSDAATAIETYWAGLSNSSPEATNYQPAAARVAAAQAAEASALASATAKLEALGLSASEVAALLG